LNHPAILHPLFSVGEVTGLAKRGMTGVCELGVGGSKTLFSDKSVKMAKKGHFGGSKKGSKMTLFDPPQLVEKRTFWGRSPLTAILKWSKMT
jgi:hypothetical protein